MDEVVTNYIDTIKRNKFVVAKVVYLIFAACVILVYVYSPNGKPQKPPPLGYYKNAAVAADSTVCSTVGKKMLLQGGNAVDAAIAALVCSGLTSPQSMGIGGGFFMTIYNRTTRKSTIIDARETAPEKATFDMFAGKPKSASSIGNLSIAIPSEIKGYWFAHQKYGRLPWKILFQDSIRMASYGFTVPIGLHSAIKDAKLLLLAEPSLKPWKMFYCHIWMSEDKAYRVLLGCMRFRKAFFNNETGDLFKLGDKMRRPQLAQTMRTIASEGVDAFYNGSLTNKIIQDLKDIGSIITPADLYNYQVQEKKPLEITLNGGVRVISPPAPSGGAVLSFILNILDGYNFTPSDISTIKSKTLTYHRYIESLKFAYAKRTGLADDQFAQVMGVVNSLTSKKFANSIRQQISDTATYDYPFYGPTFQTSNTTSTSHLSVLDQEGSAVSVTSTINSRFGSQRRGKRTGIIFNNEMNDFSFPNVINAWGIHPSPANFIVPGKRPLSSMCPAIFLDREGRVIMVLGAAGGSRITTITAWVAVHVLWLGDSIRSAVTRPRMHHQLLPPHINYEERFEAAVIQNLKSIGHNVSLVPIGKVIATVQGIHVKDGRIFANSDIRKGGTPDGF